MKESETYLLVALIFAAPHLPKAGACWLAAICFALHLLWRFILEPRLERRRGRNTP